MPTTITSTEFESLLSQASDALAAGNYSAARLLVVRARIVLAGLPNYGIGDRSAQYRSDLNTIDTAIKEVQTQSEVDAGSYPSVTYARMEAE